MYRTGWRPSKQLSGLPQWATPVNKHIKKTSFGHVEATQKSGCVLDLVLDLVVTSGVSYMCGARVTRRASRETHMFLPHKIQTSVANSGSTCLWIPYFWF